MAQLLVVDDDQDIAEGLADLLACDGHDVCVATDGLEGLTCLDRGLPDLVLLDVEMPHLTGPEMAQEMGLRDAGREKIPIVLLSGKLDLPHVAAKVGTRYFLTKPYDIEELEQLIARALEERAAPAPVARPPARAG